MNKENYISLKAEDIHKRLITDLSLNLAEAPKLLEELTASERYKEDHIFRASVETSKAYLASCNGKQSDVIKRCRHLIEVAHLLQEWELLSFDYNMMANAYFLLGLYEKALEYYYCAMNNEMEHGLKNTLPVSCANIGLIFVNMNKYEKAMEYFRAALKHIEYADKNYFRLREKKTHILSDIIISLTKLSDPDAEEVEKIYNQLVNISIEGFSLDILHSYHLGLMYYFFWKKEYDKAKQEYIQSRNIAENNLSIKLVVLYAFIEECDKNNLDLEFFENDLLEVEQISTEEDPIDEPIVYKNLKKYYLAHGDYEKAEEVHRKYKQFLEYSWELSKKKQADSIQIVESVLKGNKTVEAQNKNMEFKLVAEEAIRNKDELQKAYNRLRIIHEIGLKLTSSTDLNEVVELIYKTIRENIPTDAFMFLASEPENNQLRSLLSYNMGVRSPGFSLSFDRAESAFVKCCKYNRIISSEDDDFEPILQHIDNERSSPKDDMRTALFIPLSIGNKVIGAYSVQTRDLNSYKPEDLDFLKELRPYLVIALNNAIHSGKLQNEIKRNKEIQEKLKEANDMLSKMAGLDALTQISNRREFNEKFHELRKEASKSNKTVSVFMFDIDDFKKYNDTYGHFIGDEALKSVAKIINANINESGGIAARFGGEEFISACIGLTAEENLALGDKIRKGIYDLGIENIKTDTKVLTISVGVAISKPNKVVTKSEIMSLADEMLYEAKKTGKNKVVMKIL